MTADRRGKVLFLSSPSEMIQSAVNTVVGLSLLDLHKITKSLTGVTSKSLLASGFEWFEALAVYIRETV